MRIAPKERGAAHSWLLFLGAGLSLALLWILLLGGDPSENPQAEQEAAQAQLGPVAEADAGSGPAAAPTRLSSPLVKANLTVLLSTPAWAQLPESCEVELLPIDGTPGEARLKRTQAGGAFVEFYDLKFGNYQVRVESIGFATAEVPVSISEKYPHPRQAIPLLPAQRIQGVVTNSAGQVLAHMEVAARPVEPIRGFVATSGITKTNEQGEYVLEPLPQGRYWLHAGPLKSPISDPIEVELVGEMSYADLRVGETGTFVVQLIDETTGEVISGGRAQVQRIGKPGEMRGFSNYLDSDAEGIVRFDHVPTGEYAVTLLAPSFRSVTKRFRVESGGSEVPQRINMLKLK